MAESRVTGVTDRSATVFGWSAVWSAWRRSGARGHLFTR